MRTTQTKKLTVSAMMTAVGVVLLLLASMLPGMQLASAAVAGAAAAIVVVRGGTGYGLLTVAATALLAWLIVPAKGLVLLYTAFFGPYALVKNRIERLHRLPLEWALKLLFCAAAAVLLFRFSEQVLELVPEQLAAHLWLFLPAVLAAFAAYDIVFSKLIAYFADRLHLDR
ncbi:MAG TPA: hypothetical protein DDX51_05955 [Clostridiales bacterium]|nr:hypothetical protein [Clostridiales bacterium]